MRQVEDGTRRASGECKAKGRSAEPGGDEGKRDANRAKAYPLAD